MNISTASRLNVGRLVSSSNELQETSICIPSLSRPRARVMSVLELSS
jgi:hypothetical protein